MSGHSQFKNIMYRKGAQDAKRAKAFSRLAREIAVAVKTGGGDDPSSNSRLRNILANARGENMPRDNIERAIKKAVGGEDGADYEEVRYEGYGPGGVAIIVEALTDNRNRTASEIRASFNKLGGTLGETNSVSFMFDRLGVIIYPISIGAPDEVLEAAIEAGANDMMDDDRYEILTSMDNFASVRDALAGKFSDPTSANLVWRPITLTEVSDNTAGTLFKLIEALEDNDDAQQVVANYDVSDQFMKSYLKE
ncbi:MAG: YebC/PmpR family DNA-binding transcriptional regulator [Holosporales bacterium]|jgi:YebC/PmpR family DNA-binding regulatory protein|nr:YebC/PmpR family DNA-binding transcriptional regulator [Holosporales bacterium]